MVFHGENSLIKLFAMFLLISNATCIEETPILPATVKQMDNLAENVCMELFGMVEKFTAICEENFSNPDRNLESEAMQYRVSCRSSGRVTYTVYPMPWPQLIVAVPQSSDHNLVLRYTVIDINTNENNTLIDINTNEYYILIEEKESYTVWSTMLNDDGSPTTWRRGPDIETWSEYQTKLVNRTYNIQYDFLTEQYKGEKNISVRLSWNNFDDLDSCFSVDNKCKKKIQGDIYARDIKSYEPRSVIIQTLPLDDDCEFRVHGAHGTTTLRYRTPSCDQLPYCVPDQKGVQNITLEATEELLDTWSVRVSWVAPEWTPSHYTVTLQANCTYNATVPGNSTVAVFTGVVGDGTYEVLVTALGKNESLHASKGAMFPPRELQEEGIPVAVIWLLASCSLTALTCGAVCWRKKFTYKRRNMYFSELDKMAVEESSDWGPEDQWEVQPDRLALHEVIGEGAFGVVRRGTLAPFKDVAVKMLKDFPSAEEIRSFRDEMELMKSVGAHPHIVSLVGCCSGRRPLILVEYCSRGDLLSFLRCSWDVMMTKRNAKYYNNNKVDYRVDQKRQTDSKLVVNHLYDIQSTCDAELTLLDLLSFCRQIAMGMEFLESNRVVHRDLAARNILVTENKTLKIADFGLSRDVYQENRYKQKGNGKLPVKWMALESLTHRIYTTHSDVWSFGVVMWEILSLGGAPYAAVSAARLPRLLAAGYRMPRPLNCTPELYELMQSCWAARPRSRPTFAALHAALDAALCERADHYLALTPSAPPIRTRAAVRTLQLARSGLSWVRSKSYERPQANSNHYTVPPVATHLTAEIKIP